MSNVPPMSVAPWMLEWPRSAFTPPPGRPTLPSRSWSIAAVRMIWTPVECCVQPRAYMIVPTFCGVARRGDDLGDLQERLLRDAADPLDHLGRVAVDVLLQELEDAARVLERLVHA